jgi:2-hydroxy-6-oxonona-2,4-dienedioate hydrolase/2-hydroxy-6-oxo-6-(2'-carboxyphenyl)-hexa-2,4-dienoate hydrolase
VDAFAWKPSTPVNPKPLEQWASVAVELLGTQTRFVQGPRWRHRVIEHGQGDPLVLIHGIGGVAETFARNVRNLGKHFHVYAIDALYHGYSSKEPFHGTDQHDLQVDALVDLLDGLGHAWAHVEGESMGAQLAFELGIRYPERAGKLILNTGGQWRVNDPEFLYDPDSPDDALSDLSIKAVTEPTEERIRPRMEWLVARPERMTDEMVALRTRLYQDPEVNRSMRKVFGIDRTPGEPYGYPQVWDAAALAGYTAETLVFWTEKNPSEPPELGERFARMIPGARFYVMEDAGHWPQWEKPEEHDQVLIDFIKG